MVRRVALFACLLPVLFANVARASTIGPSATGLASPASTLTFSEVALASGTLLTNQFAAFGVTFSGVFYNPQAGFFPTAAAGNFSAPGNPPSNLTNPFSIFFTGPVSAAAFQFITNSGTSTLTARLGGVAVESFSPATSTTGAFYGFQGIVFDEILVSAGGSTNAGLIDNIQVGPAAAAAVPEPGTLLLLGTGLGVVAARRRLKKRT